MSWMEWKCWMSLSKRINSAIRSWRLKKSNACIRLYRLSALSITIGRGKDKRVPDDGRSTDGQLVCAKPSKLSVLIAFFGGSACIYGGATRKMHPFLLLKMLLSKLYTNVCALVTFRLQRIFLALLHVLFGPKSYARRSDFKIIGVISKSKECAARVWFEITGMIARN